MAHNGIALGHLQLVDWWPGPVNPNLGIPANGWDNTKDNFKTTSVNDTPSYPLGTKIMAYTDNSVAPGWYTMMYLMYTTFEDTDVSVGDYSGNAAICCHADNSTPQNYDDDVSAVPYYVVSPDVTGTDGAIGKQPRVAFPCASMDSDGTTGYTNGYGDAYGWFWVGGVCPCADATILDGTDGNKVGAVVGCGSMVSSGAIGFCWSTTNAYIERLDFSASYNTDASAGPGQLPIAGYLDTSGT